MTRKSGKLYLAGVIFALACNVAPVSAAPEFEAPAKEAQFISALFLKILEVLQSPNATVDERRATFEVILRENFDLPRIGQLALGRYWRYANATQKAEYLALFPGHIVQSYSVLMAAYTDERLEVGRVETASGKDAVVHSKVLRSRGPAIHITWRVRHSRDGLKVVDVSVEGISMVITKRAEFSSVARKRGVDGLLRRLRSRSRSEQQPAVELIAAD